MRKQALSLIALLSAVVCTAQESWTLEGCIDYALDHNLTVAQRKVAVLQSEVELGSARASRLPGVSANVSENLSFGRGLTYENTYTNKSTTSTNLNLGVDVPVFQGLRIKHNVAAKRLDLSAAMTDLEKAKDDIRVSIVQAYVQILYDAQLIEVARSEVAKDSLQVVRLTQMRLGGKASEAEVSQQRSALAQSRSTLVQNQNDYNLAVLDLTQLLELPSPEGFLVMKPSENAFAPRLLDTPEVIYAQAVGLRPSIAAEKIRLQSDSVNVKVIRSQFMPTLSLSGGIGTNFYTTSGMDNASFGKQMKNNFSQSIGLTLSVPIFSRLQIRNNVRSAELAVRNQSLAVDLAKKALYKEIQQAYYKAVASDAKFLSSSQAEESSARALELMTAKYENGKANITEYTEARSNYLRASCELASARYQAFFAVKLLDFYRGTPLTLN